MIDQVMGIIGCQVLEDEMAYVVANDPEVRHVLVIDSTQERTMAGKVQRMAPDKKVSLFDEQFDIKQFQLTPGLNVIVWVKSIGLHQSPPMLREEVSRSIARIEPLAKSILIFYGQCGNAFRNMEIFCKGVKVPVTILKDKDGAPIDDCYGTVLGGRDEYRAFLIKQPGPSFVLNTMWLANWRHFMQEMQMLHDPNDVEEAKTVFQYMDYKRTVGLNTGLVSDPVFQKQLQEFATIFGLEIENHDCTLRIVDSSYNEAKRCAMMEL
ncbi:MAG: DUF1638 domain-containing protein [Methanomassiliicoccales archaeon]|jgi:hypothetical protein|nr:DUF1638 domain-containing protein [Methanomassiliicoccales archaeon]